MPVTLVLRKCVCVYPDVTCICECGHVILMEVTEQVAGIGSLLEPRDPGTELIRLVKQVLISGSPSLPSPCFCVSALCGSH